MPAGRDAYAVGSTVRDVPLIVTPASDPDVRLSAEIVSVSPASESLAPDRRSTVKTPSVSSAVPVTAPVTTGTSSVPVIVIVIVSAVLSADLTTSVSVSVIPASSP